MKSCCITWQWSDQAGGEPSVGGAEGRRLGIADRDPVRVTGIHNRGRVVSVPGLTSVCHHSLTAVHMYTVHMWLPTELVAYPGDPEHFI